MHTVFRENEIYQVLFKPSLLEAKKVLYDIF